MFAKHRLRQHRGLYRLTRCLRHYALAGVAIAVCVLAPTASAATITVISTADVVAVDGQCTLREAITAVNMQAASSNMTGECAAGNSSSDTIIIPAGTYTLTLAGADEDNNATGDLDIGASVTIQGAGMGATVIDASGVATTPDRVFDRPVTGISVTLRDLTIDNGHAP